MDELPVTNCPLKLKTLNDLHHIRMSPTRSGGKTTFIGFIDVNEDLLKAEAVKWVKEDFEPEGFHARYGFNWNYGIEEWIKMFFNLTEEDLKDG